TGLGIGALVLAGHGWSSSPGRHATLAHGDVFLAAIAAGALLFAAAGFIRTAVREQDPIAGLLASVTILLAVGWSYDVAVPTFGPGSVSSPDIIRAAAYGLLLAA